MSFENLDSIPMTLEERRSSGIEGRLQRLEDEVRGLRTDLEEVKTGNVQILAILKKMVPIIREDFPIQTLERLKEVDEKIYGHLETYVSFQYQSVNGHTVITDCKIRKY